MATGQVEFCISQSEVRRRIRAFTVFIVFMLGGFISAFCLLLYTAPGFDLRLTRFFGGGFLAVFTIFRILTVKFFSDFLKTRIRLNGKYLERETFKMQEKLNLGDIKAVSVRRTTRGHIREIRINCHNGQVVTLDGLDSFEDFRKELVQRCSSEITCYESRERIDYDHPLFYVFLGMGVGLAGTFTIVFVRDLKADDLMVAAMIFSIYLILLGGYFMIQRPLEHRYGNRMKRSDFLYGFFMIGIAIITIMWQFG